MPLKLVPPREGKSPNYTIRGTYLGKCIDRSSGSSERRVAARVLATLKREIEEGRFAAPDATTFASAARDYLKDGRSRDFIERLIVHFADTPIELIDQKAIDKASFALCPNVSPATRNRQVYTPVSAILRHAGHPLMLRRPKGAKGKRRTAHLDTDEAFILLDAAYAENKKFGLLLVFLLYTGARLSEALKLKCDDINLGEASVYIRQTKTEEARTAHMPPVLITALANLPKGLNRPGERVFGLTKSGYLYNLLNAAVDRANADADRLFSAGKIARKIRIVIPDRVAFHIFRHTWGTWMRKYGGLDTSALVETGAWRSREAAAIYEHMNASDEAKKVILLPVAKSA